MTENKISFAVIVVTYGSFDRLAGLKKTISSAFDAGAVKVYLIDNGCDYDLKAEISQLFDGRVEYQRYAKNQGSLKGFKSGIMLALNDEFLQPDDYILILDDDVMLDNHFLPSFCEIKKSLIDVNKYVWSLYRVGRDKTVDARSDRNKNYYLNNVAGFSAFRRFSRVYTNRSDEFGRPYFIPWAGTFIKKSVLAKVKLPKSQYFVYEDDTEFSLNIRDAHYEILRSYNLKLNESSQSWFENDGNQESGYKLFYEKKTNPGRFLYKVRNSVYLGKNRLITNRTIFYMNIVIFLLSGYIRYGVFRKRSLSRLKMLCVAVHDGLAGKLGENADWKL